MSDSSEVSLTVRLPFVPLDPQYETYSQVADLSVDCEKQGLRLKDFVVSEVRFSGVSDNSSTTCCWHAGKREAVQINQVPQHAITRSGAEGGKDIERLHQAFYVVDPDKVGSFNPDTPVRETRVEVIIHTATNSVEVRVSGDLENLAYYPVGKRVINAIVLSKKQ